MCVEMLVGKNYCINVFPKFGGEYYHLLDGILWFGIVQA